MVYKILLWYVAVLVLNVVDIISTKRKIKLYLLGCAYRYGLTVDLTK